MDKELLISVVIPTYNCPEKLQKALDSVKNQTFKDFEVIVCDSSVIRVREIADNYSHGFTVKYLWEESHGGPAHARNSAINIAEGEYIAFLDSDDWWYPNKLEVIVRYLAKADVVYHDLDIYIPGGKKISKKIKGRNLKSPVFVDLMRNANALITSGVIIKKDIIEKAGGFVEGDILEDFDLWLKIARITEKFVYVPQGLGAYLLSPGTRSSASEKMAKMLKNVYDKYLVFLTQEDREQAKMVMCYLLGRLKQKMGYLEEALKLFRASVKSNNLKYKLRSACWIVFLTLSTMLKYYNVKNR